MCVWMFVQISFSFSVLARRVRFSVWNGAEPNPLFHIKVHDGLGLCISNFFDTIVFFFILFFRNKNRIRFIKLINLFAHTEIFHLGFSLIKYQLYTSVEMLIIKINMFIYLISI